MTSVLYSAGLNYQTGNPVRSEIVAVRREVGELRKQVETLTDETLVYRKYIMKLLEEKENKQQFSDFTRELMNLSDDQPSSSQPQTQGGRQSQQQQLQQNREAGSGTVQGAGFRR
jgi:hypothetical protein